MVQWMDKILHLGRVVIQVFIGRTVWVTLDKFYHGFE